MSMLTRLHFTHRSVTAARNLGL